MDLTFLLKAKKLDNFRGFLAARGAQVLVPTNQWEVIRFRAGDRVNVVYKNQRGQCTPSGDDVAAACSAFLSNQEWRAAPAGRRKNKGPRRRDNFVRTLMQRDGADCFFCGTALAEDVTIEELFSVTGGGNRHLLNCALAHAECNKKAGHMSVVEKVRLREANMKARAE